MLWSRGIKRFWLLFAMGFLSLMLRPGLGLPGLVDRSHGSPRRLVHELTKRGVDPFPSRSGVSRLLKRPDLIDPNARRKRHETFGRVLIIIQGLWFALG